MKSAATRRERKTTFGAEMGKGRSERLLGARDTFDPVTRFGGAACVGGTWRSYWTGANVNVMVPLHHPHTLHTHNPKLQMEKKSIEPFLRSTQALGSLRGNDGVLQPRHDQVGFRREDVSARIPATATHSGGMGESRDGCRSGEMSEEINIDSGFRSILEKEFPSTAS